MNLTRIPIKSDFADDVYRTLLDAITDGRLAPGTRTKQEELAEKPNVSRSPIDPAGAATAEAGRAVERCRGRSLVVAPINPVQMRQLYQVRGAIYTLAAKLAASRRARLPESILQKGRMALETREVSAMEEADMAFHSTIYMASENTFIISTTTLHWVHVRRAQGILLQDKNGWAAICDEHEDIASSIRNGDIQRAAQLSEHHTELALRSAAPRIRVSPCDTRVERMNLLHHGQNC